jgi:acetyl esterase
MHPLTELERAFAIGVLRLPRPLLRRLVGPPRRSPEGFELDLETQVLVHFAEKLGHGEFAALGPAGARRAMERSGRVLRPRPGGALTIDDLPVPVKDGVIRVRRYRPVGVTGPLPLIVYFHGGGFVVGSLDTHDGELRALALALPAVVVAVDYRLSPEHKFPVPVEDALAAFRFAATEAERWGADPTRIALAGDSAGGNLAAVVARETRGDAQKPCFQALVYPALDLTRSQPSHQLFVSDYFLTRSSLDWFLDCYTRTREDLVHPWASPLLGDDHRGLPPAYIITAGFDPLRDEGRAYAEVLKRAGTAAEYRCHEGLVHGFLQMTAGVRAAQRAFDELVVALRAGVRRV